MATYQVAVYSPSEVTVTYLGGTSYRVSLASTASPTIITVNDTNTGANGNIFNDGNPQVDGGAGWATPLQRFTANIDGANYVNQTINPEWMYNVTTGEGAVFALYAGDGGTHYGYGFTFQPTPGTSYVINTSSGTSLPNINPTTIYVCFTAGTMIATDQGEREIESLEVGDQIWTQSGYKPLRWIGHRLVNAAGPTVPVRIKAGVFGNHTDLLISQQHRMLLTGFKAELMFGERNVLVAAKNLTQIDGVFLDNSVESVEYYHILFENHEIVRANGSLSESFYPGPSGMEMLDQPQRNEILMLFPELANREAPIPMAYPALRAFEVAALIGLDAA